MLAGRGPDLTRVREVCDDIRTCVRNEVSGVKWRNSPAKEKKVEVHVFVALGSANEGTMKGNGQSCFNEMTLFYLPALEPVFLSPFIIAWVHTRTYVHAHAHTYPVLYWAPGFWVLSPCFFMDKSKRNLEILLKMCSEMTLACTYVRTYVCMYVCMYACYHSSEGTVPV
jgi:hypothetical protein